MSQMNRKQYEIRLKIKIQHLKLKVKFACKISMVMKFRSLQYIIFEDKTLSNDAILDQEKQFQNIKVEYDEMKGNLANNQQMTLQIYLHSAHGKLLIGSFQYEVSQIGNRKTYNQKIKNSPDKTAELKLTFQIVDERYSDKSTRRRSLENRDHSQLKTDSNNGLNQYSNTNHLQRSPIERTNPKMILDYKKESPKKFLSTESKTSNFLSSPRLNALNSNYNVEMKLNTQKSLSPPNIQTVKRKISEYQLASHENNKKHLNKLLQLELDLKASKEKLNQNELEAKLKQGNYKFLEKDLAELKNKNEQLENNIKNLNQKLGLLEQKNKQLDYNLKRANEQNEEQARYFDQNLKKLDKKQANYKNQITTLTEKYHQSESELQKAIFKNNDLTNYYENNLKNLTAEMKEKQKRLNEEKSSLNRKIYQIEKQNSDYKNDNGILKQKVKNILKEIQQNRSYLNKFERQNSNLNEKIEELNEKINKLEIEKLSISQELKQQKIILQQNREIKKLNQQKEEEIDNLNLKIKRLQQHIITLEEKVQQGQTNFKELQEEYTKLYFQNAQGLQELQRQKKIVDDLVQQLQKKEKAIENLNLALRNQQKKYEQDLYYLKDNLKLSNYEQQKLYANLKEAKDEAFQQKQKNKLLNDLLNQSKLKNEQLIGQMESLQQKMVEGLTQLNNFKKQNLLLKNKNIYFENTFNDFKKQSEDRQNKIRQTLNEEQNLRKQKEDEIQNFNSVLQKLNEQIRQIRLNLQNAETKIRQKSIQIQQQKQQINRLKGEEYNLNKSKYELQANNFSYMEQVTLLKQKNQQMQVKIVNLEDHIGKINELIAHLPSGQGDKNLLKESHQIQIKSLEQLIFNFQAVSQENENRKNMIQRLGQQLANQNEIIKNIQESINKKQREAQIVNREKQELRAYLQNNIQSIKEKKNYSKFSTLELLKDHSQSFLSQKENIIERCLSNMKDLQKQIQDSVEQNDQLKLKVNDYQSKISQLTIDLNEAIKSTDEKNIKLDGLQMSLRNKSNELNTVKIEVQRKKQEIQNLINQNNKLSSQLFRLQKKVQQNENQNNQSSDRIIELQKTIKSLEVNMQEREKSFADKSKELSRKIDLLKHQLVDKDKVLAQVESDRKNRISILNSSIEQFKKQNYELLSMLVNQKSNNSKLSSYLSEIVSIIAQLEKTYNIKPFSLISLKEIFRKIDQSLTSSAKIFVEYERKNRINEKNSNSNFSSDNNGIVRKNTFDR